MTSLRPLLTALGDGRFHSGASLGQALGISRAAVWKRVRALRDLGLSIDAVRGRGYRLIDPPELLDAARIEAALAAAGHDLPVSVFDSIESTNRHLLKQPLPSGQARACLAEHQSAGRGRRGRAWQTPFGAGLALSHARAFDGSAGELAGLSLAVGAAVAEALAAQGAEGILLKWPNDLLHRAPSRTAEPGEAKLGGILVELAGDAGGPCRVVVGVGLNLRVGAPPMTNVDQPWSDLARACGGVPPGRNALAAELIGALETMWQRFEAAGLAPFVEAWRARDALAGRPLRVERGGECLEGRGCGIDAAGALQLDCGGRRLRVQSGDVTVRAAG